MTFPVSRPRQRRLPPLPVGIWPFLAALAASWVGIYLGLASLLLALAGLALAGAVLLLYASLVSLAGNGALTLEEAMDLVAPLPAEEQKRAVLRALKDLEYEREVGKISATDHAELVAHYRAEARRLLQRVAEIRAEQLTAAERRADAHLRAAFGEPAPSPVSQPRAPSPRARCSACGRRVGRRARFCPACGAALAPPRREDPPPDPAGAPGS